MRVAEWKFPRAHQAGFQPPSRVIRVRGLAEHVRPGSLELYFKTRFCYNLDRIIFRGSYEYGVEEYEYRFASWKNQVSPFPFYHPLHPLLPLIQLSLLSRPRLVYQD